MAHAPGVSQVITLSVLIGGGLHLLAICLRVITLNAPEHLLLSEMLFVWKPVN